MSQLIDVVQQIRALIREAHSADTSLPLDSAAGVLDRLDRINWLCLEIKAQLEGVTLNGVVAESSYSAAPYARRRTDRSGLVQGFGHRTLPGENPEGERAERARALLDSAQQED